MKKILATTLALTITSTICPAQVTAEVPGTSVEAPSSLRQSILLAARLNPKTVATDQVIEALRYSTQAAKASLWPSGSVSCGSYRNTSDYSGVSSGTTTHQCSLSISATLYDGKAAYYRYKSAEAAAEATEAAYATTDSMIPNTRGGLAFSTMRSFVELVQNQERLAYFNYAVAVLNTFKQVGTSDALNSGLVRLQQNIQQFTDMVEINRESFRYLVTLAPAPQLENLDQTIQSLKIPESSDQAIALAMSTGPEILRRNLTVKMADYSLRATMASLGPQISVSASVSRSQGTAGGVSSRNVGFTLSVPLTAGGKYEVMSQEKILASKISERQAAIDDAKNSIQMTYRQLDSARRLYSSMATNYQNQLKDINTKVERIKQGDTANMNLLDLVSNFEAMTGQFFQLQNTQQSIVSNLFTIQQVTGLLFTDFAHP